MAFVKTVETAFIILVGLSVLYTYGLPVPDSNESSESASDESDEIETGLEVAALLNKTKELYVVRAVVYEIGILTDVSDDDNSTDSSSEERVDLTFFDTHRNSSYINFGSVPLPIQTNISGQVLTGIAPVDIGAFSSAADLLKALPITGTIVNITHSDTGYFQLKASNLTDAEKPRILTEDDLEALPDPASLLDLANLKRQPNNNFIKK